METSGLQRDAFPKNGDELFIGRINAIHQGLCNHDFIGMQMTNETLQSVFIVSQDING
jgi:hypothetical protein